VAGTAGSAGGHRRAPRYLRYLGGQRSPVMPPRSRPPCSGSTPTSGLPTWRERSRLGAHAHPPWVPPERYGDAAATLARSWYHPTPPRSTRSPGRRGRPAPVLAILQVQLICRQPAASGRSTASDLDRRRGRCRARGDLLGGGVQSPESGRRRPLVGKSRAQWDW
jgi:hypothetical protein